MAYSTAARPGPDGARRERDAGRVERLHQAVETLTLVADPLVVGHEAVVQEQLRGRDRALSHLLHRRPDGEALGAALDHERRHATRARARRDGREDDEVLGDRRVRDPRLLPVQHVAAVDPPRVRGDGRRVGSRRRLGGRERREHRSRAAQRRHPAALLLLVAERDDGVREEAARAEQAGQGVVAPRQLLGHQAGGEDVLDAAAAVLRGQRELGRPSSAARCSSGVGSGWWWSSS